MKTNPKVTIMIATYNQEQYIARTIESALAQDYDNCEIIISDDFSTDKTGEIARSYCNNDKIRYYKNYKNIGRVANYRKLLTKYATGTYVIMLDGDDSYIDTKFISTAINIIKLNQRASPLMYVACKRIISENFKKNIVHKIKNNYEIISGSEFVLGINRKYFFSHLTTIYHRDRAIELDFYKKNIISSDQESLLKLALNGNVIVSKEIVAEWIFTGQNESMIPNFNKALENLTWINSVSNILKSKTPSFKVVFWKFYMKLHYIAPVFNSLIKRRNLTIDIIYTLIKEKVILLMFIYFFYYIIKIMKSKFRLSIFF